MLTMRWMPLGRQVRRLSSSQHPIVPPPGALSLYSYAICPFCAKCKAAARYASVPLRSIEVNPLTKAEIKFSKAHRKVPIAVKADGSVIVESDRIVKEILETTSSEAKKDPDSDLFFDSFASVEAQKWAKWATEYLAVYMYPNITRSYKECRQALQYVDGVQSFGTFDKFLIKTVGAFGMSMAHGAIKRKHNITDERTALWDRLRVWETQIGNGASLGVADYGAHLGPFRGGRTHPDLGDLAVFGVLGAVHSLPLHDEIMANSPKIKAWHKAMDDALPPLIQI